MDLPPFYVGQKVVALSDGSNLRYTKGTHYVVSGIKKCKCGNWRISIEGFDYTYSKWQCDKCDKWLSESIILLASNFAPISDDFRSITLSEILEKETPLISCS